MPNLTADYIIRWVSGAKNVYNLDIDYVGVSRVLFILFPLNRLTIFMLLAMSPVHNLEKSAVLKQN